MSDLNSNLLFYNIGKVEFFVNFIFLPICIHKLDPTIESGTLFDAKLRQIKSQTSFLSIEALDPTIDSPCSLNVIEVVWPTSLTELWGKKDGRENNFVVFVVVHYGLCQFFQLKNSLL